MMWWRPGRQRRLLEEILARVKALQGTVALVKEEIMAGLDDVLADIASESDVVTSVETLLTQLSDMLKNAGSDPTKIAQAIAAIDANKARLSAAVVANTPAAPTP